MAIRKVPYYLLGMGLLTAVNAQITTPYDYISSHFVANLSVGPIWASGGQTQTLNLTPDIEKTYTANSLNQVLGDIEFFAGAEKTLVQNITGEFGLAVATTSYASLSGNIWDDALPQFNNYIYNYQLRHTHLAAKTRILIDKQYPVIPWISGSIGIGFNRASYFNNIPIIDEAVTTSNFSGHTEASFTYTIGLGIQRVLNKHWQVGMGYEFADWGQSYLGAAPEQTVGNGLALSHFYTNGLLFNLTYHAQG
jgi:hypothetical protein